MSAETPFPLDAYLARIGWSGPVALDLPTLTALHRHQLFAIPFENVNPWCGIPAELDPARLAAKLLAPGRGGYCFELNGLLHHALAAAGFRPRRLMARVATSPGVYGPRTHEILTVEIAGQPWLCDVGFGGNGLIEPIPLRAGVEVTQSHGRYRLLADETYGYRLEHARPTGWFPNYAFSLEPFLPVDSHVLNHFISRSPDSIFTRTLIVVRTTPTERRLLVADQFKVRALDGQTTARATLTTTAELRARLADDFAIHLPADFPLRALQPAPAGLRDI